MRSYLAEIPARHKAQRRAADMTSPNMRAAFAAFLQADPSVDEDKAKQLLAVYDNAGTNTNSQDGDCRLVTFTTAAKMMRISRPTVYRLVRTGKLETVPLDGVSRIRLASVFEFAGKRRSA